MTALSTVETVGVLGDRADDLAALLADHDPAITTGDPESVADADLVVADGADAAYALVRAAVTAPVLLLDADVGVPSVPWNRRKNALTHVFVGDADVRDQRLLRATVGDETHRALADVTLVTSEAARISEFGVRTVGPRGEVTVDAVRADGVVVAAPPGTHGYSNAAGGPVVAPDIEAVSVVPIAPFRVDQSNWLLPPPTTLTVERDESDVTLLVDDHATTRVPTDAPVRVDRDGTLRLVTTPVTAGVFE